MATTDERLTTETASQPTMVREFATQWNEDVPTAWRTYESADELSSSVIRGGRGTTVIRYFDFFTGRSVGFSGAVTLYEHDLVRVLAQNPARRDPFISRFANFDAVYIQYSGTSSFETEYGPYTANPFQMMFVPAGIAHRSTGDPECRRLLILSRERLDPVSMDFRQAERRFVVESSGGITWPGVDPHPAEVLDGDYEPEACWLWDDPIETPTWYRRRKGLFAGGTTGGREPVVFGAYDFLGDPAVAQKSGNVGPYLFTNRNMRMRSYNLEGRQFGFHRGNGQDELWMQFRSTSRNNTEDTPFSLSAGEMGMIFPGNAHQIIGERGFLRTNLYSERPLRLCVDPLQAVTRTEFRIEELT